jgi:hypothetical protein
MSRPRILLCLDADPQPSVFDGIVALDSGVDHLLRHGGVTPDAVRELVYGAMFTRGPDDLRHTAIFIGGSDVAAGEALLAATVACFFGPMRVSVMLDPNGANTTAAAAVLAAGRHVPLAGAAVTVLAATGPVGRRVVRLLARDGADVAVASRSLARAQSVCNEVAVAVPGAKLTPHQTASDDETRAAVATANMVIAAGAPGVELLSEEVRRSCDQLQVAVDLSAVPPTGIGGVEMHDKATSRDGQTCYGAIGVGGTKMKIHQRAVRSLFEASDRVLDAEEMYALAKEN